MLLYLGPILFGFIIGFLLGTRIKDNPKSDVKFTVGSYVVIFITVLIVAWQIGPYPFYDDIPLNTAFASAVVGLIAGKFVVTGINLK